MNNAFTSAARRGAAGAILLLALALLPAWPCRAADKAAAPPPVAWRSFREATAEARHRDCPLLVFFSAAWKASSVRLDRETWSDPRVRRYLDENIVAAAVDMQDMPAVAKHFGIAEPPAILLLAPDGTQLAMLRGFHGPAAVVRVCTYAASGAWEYTDYETWLSHNLVR
jgi:thioredoxin-related protein